MMYSYARVSTQNQNEMRHRVDILIFQPLTAFVPGVRCVSLGYVL